MHPRGWAIKATAAICSTRSNASPRGRALKGWRPNAIGMTRLASASASTSGRHRQEDGVHACAGSNTTEIDRSRFTKALRLLAVRVPCSRAAEVRKELKRLRLLLNVPRVKPIVPAPSNPDHERLVLMRREDLDGDGDIEGLLGSIDANGQHGGELTGGHGDHPELQTLVQNGPFALEWYTHQLDYSYWTASQVLRHVLPCSVEEVPSAFETVGHIAHLNLRDDLLPYKRLIGQVILDKNAPRIRTVVNKMGKIENTFRVLPMEVIAGEDDMEAKVIQHRIHFAFNFAEVYWNSRLEQEHARLVSTFQPGQTILDLTAGVGPFAIPAAKKGCTVHANDLNPRCVAYLAKNAKANGVSKIQTYCMDAKDFVRKFVAANPPALAAAEAAIAGDPSSAPPSSRPVPFDHAVMNLPASGVELLTAFKGFLPSSGDGVAASELAMPLVHCYTFGTTATGGHKVDGEVLDSGADSNRDSKKASDAAATRAMMAEVVREAEQVLGCPLDPAKHQVTTREVRDVAPNKRMVLLSFRVPVEVAAGIQQSIIGPLDSLSKKRKKDE